MARQHDAKIVILHSVEPLRDTSYAYAEAALDPGQLKEDKKQERTTELNEIKKRVEQFCERMDASCLELDRRSSFP